MNKIVLITSLIVAVSVAAVTTTLLVVKNKSINISNTTTVTNTTAPTNINETTENVNTAATVNTNQAPVANVIINKNTTVSTKPVIKNTNNTKSVNVNTAQPVVPTVDPAVKIELCKTEASTAASAATTDCTNALLDAFEKDPNTAVWKTNIADATAAQAACSTQYTDITDPYARQSLITQCYNNNQTIINSSSATLSSNKSKYLAGVPACTDAVYQKSYSACLLK